MLSNTSAALDVVEEHEYEQESNQETNDAAAAPRTASVTSTMTTPIVNKSSLKKDGGGSK